MALRTFTDSSGVSWTVWDTIRSTDAPVTSTLAGGWLTFESERGEKRRLAPIPLYWANAPEGDLHQLLERARPVTPRSVGEIDATSGDERG